jgi:hypothetical protein
VDGTGIRQLSLWLAMSRRKSNWEAFSQDWQAVLDLESPSKLTCLKMAQAYRRPEKQFYQWTEKQRDDRLIEFVKTINRHVAHGVVSVIPIEPYQRLFKGKFKPMALDRPYFLSFFGMLIRLLRIAQGKKEDRIDFFSISRVENPHRFCSNNMKFAWLWLPLR